MSTPRFQQFLLLLLGISLSIVGVLVFLGRKHGGPRIPAMLAGEIPASSRQLVLVLSPQVRSTTAHLWLLEKADSQSDWRTAQGPIAVSLGRSGLAWGLGLHQAAVPDGYALKREGDGCSPAGIFELPYAFGYAPPAEASFIHLPYISLTDHHFGVDDSQSHFYNQVVDATAVAKDWQSAEIMRRNDPLYQWGAFVAHNPAPEKQAGSCIFLHIWKAPGSPTAGCTAMSESDIKKVLAWLDSARHPVLLQAVNEAAD